MNGLIDGMKRKLAAEFEMKELGMMHYFLSMEVWQNVDGLSVEGSQSLMSNLQNNFEGEKSI